MAWTDNLLVHEERWGDGVRVGSWAWRNKPGFLIGFDVLWRGVVPVCAAYLPRSLKMRAQPRAAPVTLTFRSTVWRGLKISCTPTTSAVTSGLIGPKKTNMIYGTNGLLNNFCLKLLLIVWVATSGSLIGSFFGLLPALTNFSESLIASTYLSESFIWSTCLVESFLNQFLVSTCSSESFIKSTCSSD